MKHSLNVLIRACDVTRWHTVNTTKKQTLAEHHWAVLMILAQLMEIMNMPMSMDLMWETLLHDIDEVWKGDTPAPRKDASYGAGHLTVAFTDENQALIKVADAIEAYWWILNNRQGSYSEKFVVLNCHSRMMRRAKQAEEQFFGEGFTDKVFAVFQKLAS